MTANIESSNDYLKILCGTWNVGGFQPKEKVDPKEPLDLSGWIKVPDVDLFQKSLF